jgi:hypothetical protein
MPGPKGSSSGHSNSADADPAVTFQSWPESQSLLDIKDWKGRGCSNPAACAISQHVLTGTSSRHRVTPRTLSEAAGGVSCTSTTGAGGVPVCVVEVVISRFIQYVDEVEDA